MKYEVIQKTSDSIKHCFKVGDVLTEVDYLTQVDYVIHYDNLSVFLTDGELFQWVDRKDLKELN